MAQTRPTKKQHQLLDFIRQFIEEHGYSPSYREIMRGCNYTSVATVALHVNNLITRGHLRKRDNSARSLEVVSKVQDDTVVSEHPAHAQHIVSEIEARLKKCEKQVEQALVDEVYVLIGALKVLGHTELARAYAVKLPES